MFDNSPRFHLAEINIAKMRSPLEDVRMADFANALETINRLAETRARFYLAVSVG